MEYKNKILTDEFFFRLEALIESNYTLDKFDNIVLKIPKKGYKDGKGSRGDLFVNVNIMVPKELSNEEKELFKKLSNISNFNPRNS